MSLLRYHLRRQSGPGGPAMGIKAMTHDVTESLVLEWLRNHHGRAYCSDCIARELKQDVGLIRPVMSKLVFAQHAYWAGHCDCGNRGFKHGR